MLMDTLAPKPMRGALRAGAPLMGFGPAAGGVPGPMSVRQAQMVLKTPGFDVHARRLAVMLMPTRDRGSLTAAT